MDQNYIDYKLPSSLSVWKERWFYIGNHKPAPAKRTNDRPKIRFEWLEKHSKGDMDQVNELIDLIKAHGLMGVTGASLMYSWIARHIQPL
jgi:hypothetical protein